MQLRNSQSTWGLVSISLHWLVAMAVFTLFPLGVWMRTLGYYDAWYELAPSIHKSIGVTLAAIVLVRIMWRLIDTTPDPIAGHNLLEKRLANAVHWLLYLLLFTIFISGYLISTAEGRPIEVFSLISLPAILSGGSEQADIAGVIHKLLAYTLISLVVLHALGAVKHHFIDHDQTLKRMLGRTQH